MPNIFDPSEYTIRYDGAKCWIRDSKYHRDDAPAVIYPDGSEVWYQFGHIHRGGAPAVIYPDGTHYWYSWGKIHRLGGPAIIRRDGNSTWYRNGKMYDAVVFSNNIVKFQRILDITQLPSVVHLDMNDEIYHIDDADITILRLMYNVIDGGQYEPS